MKMMTLESLEETLEDILPTGFQIEVDDEGQVVIFTNLSEDEDTGELVRCGNDDVDSDFDDDVESYDESCAEDE